MKGKKWNYFGTKSVMQAAYGPIWISNFFKYFHIIKTTINNWFLKKFLRACDKRGHQNGLVLLGEKKRSFKGRPSLAIIISPLRAWQLRSRLVDKLPFEIFP